MRKETGMPSALKGVGVLTATSFVAKVLAALYRVPYQNLVGDQGFFVYQQVYPIYGLAMTLALGGFPIFVSKLVAESQDEQQLEEDLGRLFFFLSIFAILLWAFTFFGSGWIANRMGQSQLALVIRMSSFTFLLMPTLSILRGIFQGKLEMAPTGISQICEQLLRVIIIWSAAFGFVQFGLDIFETGTIAMLGSLFGGGLALSVLLHYKRKVKSLPKFTHLSFQRKGRPILSRMLLEGGTISVFSGYLILLQMVDSFTIVRALIGSGIENNQAEVLKGTFDRAQPLTQLGLVIALSLTSSFLPMLTKAFVSRDKKEFQRYVELFLKLSFTLSIAATAGLIALLPWINFTLFENNHMVDAIAIFLLSIFLMIMAQTYQSIFQSRGSYRFSLFAASIGLLVKMIVTYPLTYMLGTIGASFSTILALVVVYTMMLLHGREYKLGLGFVVKNIISSGGMMFVLLVFQTLIPHTQRRLMTLGLSILGVIIGASVFLLLNFFLKTFSRKEISELPIVNKFVK